jgi:pimeloyl-ACP methyl ester carboxylesterase
MSQQHINTQLNPHNMAPVVVIPCFGVGPELQGLYKWMLNGDSVVSLPPEDRYLPIPSRGLGEKDEMIGVLDEKLDEAYQRLEEPVVIAAHSLGVLFATSLAIRNPDKVRGVYGVGGAHLGIKVETLSIKAIKAYLGESSEYLHIRHDSEHMVEHKRSMAEDWPEGVELCLVSTPIDDLVLFPHGLDVKLPNDREAEKRVLGVPDFIVKRLPGLPKNTRGMMSYMSTHIDMPLNPTVVKRLLEIRRAVYRSSTDPEYIEPKSRQSEPRQLVAA